MSNYENEILARLQKGEKVEDIASELTESLNAANNKYQAEAAAAKAKDELYSNKVNAAKNLLNDCAELLKLYDVEECVIQELNNTPIEEIVDTLDTAVPFLTKYWDLLNTFAAEAEPEAKNKETCGKGCPKAAVDPIDAFLNAFVR